MKIFLVTWITDAGQVYSLNQLSYTHRLYSFAYLYKDMVQLLGRDCGQDQSDLLTTEEGA